MLKASLSRLAGRSLYTLARIGTRSQVGNPVLEPLFRTVRANHPKADLALLERAYDTAEGIINVIGRDG